MAEARKRDHADGDKSANESENFLYDAKKVIEKTKVVDIVMDVIGSPIVIFGLSGSTIKINKAARKMLGIDFTMADRASNIDRLNIRHLDGRKFTLDELPSTQALQGKQVRNEQILLTSIDKRERIVDASIKPIYVTGRIAGAVLIFQDITENTHREMLDEALDDINTIEQSSLSIDEVMNSALSRAAQALHIESGHVIIRENSGWRVRNAYDPSGKMIDARFTAEECPQILLATMSRKPVIINDAYQDERVNQEIIHRYNIRSLILVPIIAREEILGVLCLTSHRKPVAFSEAQISFASRLSTSLSRALGNTLLYRAAVEAEKTARVEVEITETLLKASRALALSRNLQEVFESFANIMIEATGRSRIAITMMNAESKEWVIPYAREKTGFPAGLKVVWDIARQVIDKVLTIKAPVVIDIESREIDEDLRKAVAPGRLRYLLDVPLIYKGNVIGALALDEPGSEREFTERDIRLAEGIASQAAIAIENARLYELLQEEARLSDALNNINTKIATTFRAEEILQQAIEMAAEVLGVEGAGLISLENDEWVMLHTFGHLKDKTGLRIKREYAPVMEYIAKKRELMVLKGLPGETPSHIRAFEYFGIKSVLVIPLEVRKEVIGGMVFTFHTAAREFDKIQIDFARKLSISISLALENARLYEEERNIADTLQEAILAMPERIDNIDYGRLYRSATTTAQVGGDFYDLFEITSEKVGFLIGDVSGKGLGAAAITSTVKNSMKALSYEYSMPEEIVAKTNDLVVKNTSPSMFITLFCGILDLANLELRYCSAGHPSALIKRETTVELLEMQSPIVGVFPGLKYLGGKTTIHKNDLIILYTDGIIEARRNDEFYGEKRLIEFVNNLPQLTSKETCNAIFEDVLSFTRGRLFDDVALLIVSPG